jgi:hypothetical protein
LLVATSRLNGLARFGQGEEDVLVEAFVAQPAVERFDDDILRRFAAPRNDVCRNALQGGT